MKKTRTPAALAAVILLTMLLGPRLAGAQQANPLISTGTTNVTTDGTGFATVAHDLGVVPTYADVSVKSPTSGSNCCAVLLGTDTYTATSFRVRFGKYGANTNFSNKAMTLAWLVEAAGAPPTTSTTTTSSTTTTTAPGGVVWPGPANPSPAPTCPAVNPTWQRSGAQIVQYRPDALSNTTFDLGNVVANPAHAFWGQGTSVGSPNPLVYPAVIDESSDTANGTNTCLLGGAFLGNLDTASSRAVQYDDFHSGLEYGNNSATGTVQFRGQRWDRYMDSFRCVGTGTCYVDGVYASNLLDNFGEADAHTGNLYVRDSLFEAAYSGFSEENDTHPAGTTTTIDGVLGWLKPTVDTKPSQGGVWCGGDGCPQLEATGKGNAGLWEGGSVATPTLVVRNSWFRFDDRDTWDLDPTMSFPCTPNTNLHPIWSRTTNCTYSGVKVLWTKDNSPPVPLQQANLPAGVTVVTGQEAIDTWNAGVTQWKAAHGY